MTQAIRSTNETDPSRISSSGTRQIRALLLQADRARERAGVRANTPAVVSAPAGEIDASFTSAVNSASARSCVTPDFMRPSRKRDELPPVSPAQRLGRKMSASGSAPSRGITGLKLKSGGSTPTTGRARPSMVMDCPTIAGSALSDVRHSRSLTIALRSSSGAAAP